MQSVNFNGSSKTAWHQRESTAAFCLPSTQVCVQHQSEAMITKHSMHIFRVSSFLSYKQDLRNS